MENSRRTGENEERSHDYEDKEIFSYLHEYELE